MTNKHRLYTIGHSSLALDEFLTLLTDHKVTAIADVRSQPYSRMYPHFSKPQLRDTLRASGFHYVFLGRELGARRDERECYEGGQAKYNLIARAPKFKQGIARVSTGAATETIALLCAEKDPLTCHRSILVCRELRTHGLDIQHIHSDGTIEEHHQAERRLMREEGMNPDQFGLFEFEAITARVELAYELRGEKIAYRMKAGDEH